MRPRPRGCAPATEATKHPTAASNHPRLVISPSCLSDDAIDRGRCGQSVFPFEPGAGQRRGRDARGGRRVAARDERDCRSAVKRPTSGDGRQSLAELGRFVRVLPAGQQNGHPRLALRVVVIHVGRQSLRRRARPLRRVRSVEIGGGRGVVADQERHVQLAELAAADELPPLAQLGGEIRQRDRDRG